MEATALLYPPTCLNSMTAMINYSKIVLGRMVTFNAIKNKCSGTKEESRYSCSPKLYCKYGLTG